MHEGFIDTRRGVLVLTGGDARDVLQNIVTNDVDGIDHGLVYAALLTPQGKFLFDFFLACGTRLGHPPGSVLIECAVDRAADLARRLAMYCLRRDAAVAATKLDVALVWGSDTPPEGLGTVFADPRDPALGWRCWGRFEDLPDTVRAADAAAHDRLRVAHAIPASGIELVPDQTFILEAGFERLAGVDFRKGCYVGQEVTARMKHKTDLRKGLVRVEIEGEAAPGTPIEIDGKPAGTLFTQADGQALAHLRFDRATGDMTAGGARVRYAGASSSSSA